MMPAGGEAMPGASLLHLALEACVLLTAAGLGLSLLNLFLIPRLGRGGGPRSAPALVSVVIPARNEERDVEQAVRSQLRQDYERFEVVAVDDRSTDSTPAILTRLAAEDSRLRVVSGAEPPPGWLGKPHALRQGAAAARGELLLFVDADVRYEPAALSEAIGHLEREGLDFLTLLPRVEMRGFWENVLMPYLLLSFFQAPGFLANWRRPRSVAVGGGAGNLVRRAVYDSVGGHEALRDSVIDDVRLGLAVKRGGFRFGLVRAEERVAVRMYRGFREVFDGFTKNAAYVFQGAVGAALLGVTLAILTAAILPPAILVAAAVGGSIAPADVGLAVAGLALALLGRIIVAGALGDPLWPAATHPIMAAVFSAILARSLYYRFVRRRLTWRGRQFEARLARF